MKVGKGRHQILHLPTHHVKNPWTLIICHTLNTLGNRDNGKILIGHLNANRIEKNVEPFVSLVKDKLDIILLSETKIDKSFPSSQFAIEGSFRRDRDIHGGGLYSM